MNVLVDSSVILDIFTNDPQWAPWSENQLATLNAGNELIINDVIWAECSAAFTRIEDYRKALSFFRFSHRAIPHDALFLSAKAFLRYRRSGGSKTAPLPDFFIGAHAAVSGMTLLTRDPRRVVFHFPSVEVISP